MNEDVINALRRYYQSGDWFALQRLLLKLATSGDLNGIGSSTTRNAAANVVREMSSLSRDER